VVVWANSSNAAEQCLPDGTCATVWPPEGCPASTDFVKLHGSLLSGSPGDGARRRLDGASIGRQDEWRLCLYRVSLLAAVPRLAYAPDEVLTLRWYHGT
jgi:hypothetical protein